MALMRARVLDGPAQAHADVRAVIERVAHAPRDPAKLREDVLAMRAEMATHKPGKGPLDVKLSRGGLVDLEFLVHFLQLRRAACIEPDLRRAIGCLVDAGHLTPAVADAHDLLTRVLVTLRLVSPDAHTPPPAARAVLAANARVADWEALIAALDKARRAVAEAWATTFDETLEISA